jgi:hypothetical protein
MDIPQIVFEEGIMFDDDHSEKSRTFIFLS